MHLILVRHGETKWSRTGQHTGTTDIDLLPEGHRQAESIPPLVARLLQGRKPTAVYTSPLKRAVDTARLAWPASEAEICEHLRECDYGNFEGLSPAEIRALRPDWDFWRDGCENGENAAAVGARADRFLSTCAEVDQPVIAFSHGHMIRIMAARAVGLQPEQAAIFTLATASVSLIQDIRGKRAIAAWNLTAG